MTIPDSSEVLVEYAGAPAKKEQRVLFLLLPEVQLLDLAGPAQVFPAATELGIPCKLVFCASRTLVRSAQGLTFAQLEPLVSVTSDDLEVGPGYV